MHEASPFIGGNYDHGAYLVIFVLGVLLVLAFIKKPYHDDK